MAKSWFETTALANFEDAFGAVKGRKDLRFLQLGVYEGDATVWLMENVLTDPSSKLYDVDTWDGGGGDEFADTNWHQVFGKYSLRTKHWRENGQLFVFKMTTFNFLTDFATAEDAKMERFDFVYVDADHSAVSTLENGVLGYKVLKPGGILCFDDYMWRHKNGALYEPWLAVDLMKVIYYNRLWCLNTGSQCWFRKIA